MTNLRLIIILISSVVSFYLQSQCTHTPTIEGETILCPLSQYELNTQVYDSYQWFKNGVPISGETNQNIVLSGNEVGNSLSVETTLNGCTEMSEEVILDAWNWIPIYTSSHGEGYLNVDGVWEMCDGDKLYINLPPGWSDVYWYKDNAELLTYETSNTLEVTESGSYFAVARLDICPVIVEGTSSVEVNYTNNPIICGPVTECTSYDKGPYFNLNNNIGTCAEISQPDVKFGSAYVLENMVVNENYTLGFCELYQAFNNAIITISEYDNITQQAIPNTVILNERGCNVDFQVPNSGDYIAVISSEDNCGSPSNNNSIGQSPYLERETSYTCEVNCATVFTDLGGDQNNYTDDSDWTYLICASDPSCNYLKVEFESFDLVSTGSPSSDDNLKIYNSLWTNPNINGTDLIGTYYGNDNPGVLTSDNVNECFAFTFTSNGSGNSSGWKAYISCETKAECICPEDYFGIENLRGYENGFGGIFNNGFYATDGKILSHQNIIGGTVEYNSAEEIQLGVFEVKLGAEFEAKIIGCNP